MIVDPYKQYSYQQMKRDMIKLRQTNRELIHLGCAGKSEEGRDLLYLTLGRGKNQILLVGAHHAREYITAAFLMKMCEYYTILYDEKASLPYDVKEILERVCLIVLPMVNPDGVEIVRKRKKKKGIYHVFKDPAAWKANAQGIDLNRNYPCLFLEKESHVLVPASENYKGKFPGEAAEVRAVMELCYTYNIQAAVTLHTKGEEILYGDTNSVHVNEEGYRYASALQKMSGYTVMPVSNNPAVFAAGFENWFRSEFGKPCILVETTPFTGGEQPHHMADFDELIWNNMKWLGLCMANVMENRRNYT